MIDIYLLSASKLLKQNVIALIEGSNLKISACVLSTVTGIPLIRLHGYSRPFEQCDQAIKIPAEYRDYAHATLDIIYTFRWGKIALVFDGKTSLVDFPVLFALACMTTIGQNVSHEAYHMKSCLKDF